MSFINRLLSAIGSNPGTTAEELSDTLKTQLAKVRNHLHQAKHLKLIDRKMDDVTHQPGYHLTAAGRAKLAEASASVKPTPPEPKPARRETPPAKPETPAQKTGTEPVPDTDSEGGESEIVRAMRETTDLNAENHLLAEQIANLHNALAELLPPDWPIDPSDMSTEDIVRQLASTIVELRSRTECTLESRPDDDAIDIKDAARGYLVAAYKRKPRRVTEETSARNHAMAAVRNGAQWAEVYALVPIASVRRGAVWSTQ